MSIIVPIHDAPAVTRRCLLSLERYATKSQVILVDDASELGETIEIIRDCSERNGWVIVRHEQALGHSEACRDGARLADREFLCLLNSDTVVTPWCWRLIKECFDKDERIAAAGSSTSNSGNCQTLPLARAVAYHLNDNQICALANRLMSETNEAELADLPWVAGFAFFIRRILWEELGGFDPKLPDYGNEMELCDRLSARGYRLVWVRRAYIHHVGAQSYRDAIGKEGIATRNRVARDYMKEKKRFRS